MLSGFLGGLFGTSQSPASTITPSTELKTTPKSTEAKAEEIKADPITLNVATFNIGCLPLGGLLNADELRRNAVRAIEIVQFFRDWHDGKKPDLGPFPDVLSFNEAFDRDVRQLLQKGLIDIFPNTTGDLGSEGTTDLKSIIADAKIDITTRKNLSIHSTHLHEHLGKIFLYVSDKKRLFKEAKALEKKDGGKATLAAVTLAAEIKKAIAAEAATTFADFAEISLEPAADESMTSDEVNTTIIRNAIIKYLGSYLKTLSPPITLSSDAIQKLLNWGSGLLVLSKKKILDANFGPWGNCMFGIETLFSQKGTMRVAVELTDTLYAHIHAAHMSGGNGIFKKEELVYTSSRRGGDQHQKVRARMALNSKRIIANRTEAFAVVAMDSNSVTNNRDQYLSKSTGTCAGSDADYPEKDGNCYIVGDEKYNKANLDRALIFDGGPENFEDDRDLTAHKHVENPDKAAAVYAAGKLPGSTIKEDALKKIRFTDEPITAESTEPKVYDAVRVSASPGITSARTRIIPVFDPNQKPMKPKSDHHLMMGYFSFDPQAKLVDDEKAESVMSLNRLHRSTKVQADSDFYTPEPTDKVITAKRPSDGRLVITSQTYFGPVTKDCFEVIEKAPSPEEGKAIFRTKPGRRMSWS